MSMPSSDVRTPNCSLSRVWSAISAACSRAFVGMHPRCRHVPPTLSFSTIATERFSSAARSAAASPPLPAPRTTTSYTFSPLPEVAVDSDTGRSLAFPHRLPGWYLPRRVCTAGLPTPSCHSLPAIGALPPAGTSAPPCASPHQRQVARGSGMGLLGRLRAGTAARSERRQEVDDVRRHL